MKKYTKRCLTALLTLAMIISLMPTVAYADPPGVVIADQSTAAPIYIDSDSEDYDGIFLAAQAVSEDIRAITGTKPAVVTAAPTADFAIVAGTLEDDIIQDLDLSWSIAETDWERYQVQVVENPKGLSVGTAVVIAGSDKRGVIYGLYYISQDLGGVSPWVYWADVPPTHKDSLTFSKAELETTSVEPSVKYRGIFLNDEAPSLSSFVANTFGEFNYQFYDTVFELVLRLKGNYLWPAMWNNQFSEDGVLGMSNPPSGEDRYSNIRHADAYGVVMGASHHEPMARGGVEFGRVQDTNPPTYNKPTLNGSPVRNWDYINNKDNIYDFWVDGIERNKAYDTIITVGMRGENDSALGNFTLEQNIALLEQVITDQNKILEDADYEDAVKMFAAYKEVEPFWYGNENKAGLNEFDLLDDTIIMLCEDNNGQLRTLPGLDEADRPGGWGMYYHFDFHGGPTSYEWIACHPMQRIWDNMTMAYDYGVDDLWIVNVGDLKPMELPISYFLDMAYDFDKWGSDHPNSAQDYIEQWTAQQFGAALNATEQAEVAQIFTDYLNMNTNRHPEMVQTTTFNTTNYNEAQVELSKAFALKAQADKYYEKFKGTNLEDAYYQLVYYPAAAVANIREMYIFAGLAARYASMGSAAANLYADLSAVAIQRDIDLTDYYNTGMSGGYWNGMMSSPHVGYVSWDSSGWSYPASPRVAPSLNSEMIVDVDGSATGYRTGTAALPEFTSVGKEAYAINISNAGSAPINYTATPSDDWILIDGNSSPASGKLYTLSTLGISVDWSKINADASGTVQIVSGGQTVTVSVNAKIIDVSSLPAGTAVMQRGSISVGAESYTAKGASADGNTAWGELENYGKFVSTLKMFPTTSFFPAEGIDNTNHGPYLEYKVHVPEAGNYQVRSYFGTSNPPYRFSNNNLRYGLQVNGGNIVVGDSIADDYAGGEYSPGSWSNDISNNGRYHDRTNIALSAGVNTIRFYGVDAGVLFQKFVISAAAPLASYYGPEATYIVGDAVAQKPLVFHKVSDEKNFFVPGKIPADEYDGSMISGDLSANANGTYAYSAKIDSKGVYVFSVEGFSADRATATLKINGAVVGEAVLSPNMDDVKSYEFAELQAGPATIELTVSGDATIRSIIGAKANEKEGSRLSVSGSSNDADAALAADKKRATAWTPANGDAAPALVFDYGADAVYADSFKIIGDLSGVTGYVVETGDNGVDWTQVAAGGSLSNGNVFFQGTEAFAGSKWRVRLSGSGISIAELAFNTYVNWALDDDDTTATVSKNSSNPSVIIDGNRIGNATNGSGAWIAEQGDGQYATLTFGKPHTLTGVNVIGLQKEIEDGIGAGQIPSDTLISSLVPIKYTVEYLNGDNWTVAALYETGAADKRTALTHIEFDAPIETIAVRVVIGTNDKVRLVEFEPVEAAKFSLKALEKGVKNWALASEGGTITRQDISGISYTTDTGFPGAPLSRLNDDVVAGGTEGSSAWAPAGAQSCMFWFSWPTYLTVSLAQPVEIKQIVSITQQATATPAEPTPDMTTTMEHTPATIQYWNGMAWVDAAVLARDAAGDIKVMREWTAAGTIVTDQVRFVYEDTAPLPGGFWYSVILTELQVFGKAFESPITDKSALTALYDAAKATLDLGQGSYTDGSWTAFENAMTSAMSALTSFTADQDDIDAACAALNKASAGLRTQAQLNSALLTLQIGVGQSENVGSEAVYTPATWAVFDAALTAGKAMLASPDEYTLDELRSGGTALMSAIANLEFAVVKDNLQFLVDMADEMLLPENVGEYIPAAVANLTALLSSAKAILADPDATQAQVDSAANTLFGAMEVMQLKADKTSLQELLNQLADYVEAKYTPASWTAFADAKAYAISVIANENAVAEQAEKAYDDLFAAVIGLKLRANFTGLETVISQAQGILAAADNYVPSSIAGLADETTAALAVCNDKNSTQAQIETARSALIGKIVKARLKANMSPITSALGIVTSLNLNLYTVQSAGSLTDLVAEAQAVLNIQDTLTLEDDQNRINALAERILGAVNALVPVIDTQSGGGLGAPSTGNIAGIPSGGNVVGGLVGDGIAAGNAIAGNIVPSADAGQNALSPGTIIDPGSTPLAGSDGTPNMANILPWIIGAAALIIIGLLIKLLRKPRTANK